MQQRTVRLGSKALNKPLLICGVDRKLLGVSLLLSLVVATGDTFLAKFLAVAVMFALCGTARMLTRKDHRLFEIARLIRTQKSLYDPMKREWNK